MGAGRVDLIVLGAIVSWTGAGGSGLAVGAKVFPVGDSMGLVVGVRVIVDDIGFDVDIEVGAG